MFAMSGDGVDDVNIPSVFLYSREKDILLKAITSDPHLEVNYSLNVFVKCNKIITYTRFSNSIGEHNANDWIEETIGNNA